jgi:chromosome segregation ATPase
MSRLIPIKLAEEAMAKLEADNARLKAEVERLETVIESHKDAGKRLLAMLDDDCLRIKHLKAEVERLEARIEYVDNLANRYALDDVRSQAQVERLTKAGDEFSDAMDSLARFANEEDRLLARKASLDFKAAKEGKQP